MYGGGGGSGGGGGNRPSGVGGVSCTTAGLTYADSVRTRAPFEPIGRPLRSSQHHSSHRHPPQTHQYQQQLRQRDGALAVADNSRPVADVNSSAYRVITLETRQLGEDDAAHGQPANSSVQQFIACNDQVRDDTAQSVPDAGVKLWNIRQSRASELILEWG